MATYLLVSVAAGILFMVMDGAINANPLAQRLYEVYRPIARKYLNLPAAVAIDLAYGFVLAAVFTLLYGSLPGGSGLAKGISYASIVWFFRVVMYALSQWAIIDLPLPTILYMLLTGLGEMLVLGLLFGLTLTT